MAVWEPSLSYRRDHFIWFTHHMGRRMRKGEGDDAAPGLLGTTLQKLDVMFSL